MNEIYKNLDLEDLPNEEWKNIQGFEGLYQISNLGRIKSLNYLHTGKPQILKQELSNKRNGYLQVKLSKDGKKVMLKIHRLVALAFIPNPNNHPQINHKDEIKENNCVSNLEWMTAKDNCNYGTHNEKLSIALKGRKYPEELKAKVAEKLYNRPDLSKQIVMVNPKTKIGRKWNSAMQAQRENGFNQASISRCCKGKSKTHKGFEFSYFSPPMVIR